MRRASPLQTPERRFSRSVPKRYHVAPWRSVYKVHLYADTDITFVLTKVGHNAGIVSEPGRPGRCYRMTFHEAAHRYVHPQRWFDTALTNEGSWWPAWEKWLAEHSTGKEPAPASGAPKLGVQIVSDAPGEYVSQT